MDEQKQAQFNGWAKVEVMGHQSHIGYVTTEAYGGAVLFRIDQPEVPASEEILDVSDWVGNQRCPAGTVVKRAAIQAVSVLVGSGSIYRIIPCTEDAAMKAIRSNERRPLSVVRLPEAMAIEAPDREADDDDEDPDPHGDGDF